MGDPHVRAAWSTLLVLALVGPGAGFAAGPSAASGSSASLKKLSIEELLELEVTSVSGSEESLGGAAAAVAVVTRDVIRRSGATSLPEALRLVPGLHVAQRGSNVWAISSRGLSSVTSEKLLVLADTRSIYTPLFSGVQWDVQDFLLEDIERVEVIRGPGATLWGSNAVAGVINITTRSARDTHGLYLQTGAGDEDRAIVAARYGARAGEDFHYRVFGRYAERDGSFENDPVRSDDWRMGHLGFRADWSAGERDSFTLQGDAYHGNIGQLFPAVNIIGRPQPQGDLEVDVSGGNVLGRWQRALENGASLQLRAYVDRTRRDDPTFLDRLNTLDLDLRHALAPAGRHSLLWGVSYRVTSNRNESKGVFAVDPEESDDQFVSAFVQDRIALTDAFELTVGTKLEHSDFSDFEIQPSVRAAWKLDDASVLWAAVSRAVRVPTRLERDVAIDVTDPAADPVVRLLGNDDFESEELLAWELGYRWHAAEHLIVDLATFYNEYDGLASLELGTPFVDAQGRTIVPIINRNLIDGHALGGEALVTWSPFAAWQLSASYSYVDADLDSSGQDLNRGEFRAGSTPRHQIGLRSLLDLPYGIALDLQLRSLSRIRSQPDTVDGSPLPGYTELDVRVGWQAREGVELSLIGRNLLHDHHAEFGGTEGRGELERSVFGRVAWRF